MNTFQTYNDQRNDESHANEKYKALVEGASRIPNEKLLQQVQNGGFSWCTFLIGPLYWAYRKCYAEAAVLVLFNMAVSLLPDSPVWLVLSVATSVVLGFAFPYLYRWRAERLYTHALSQGTTNDQMALEYVRSHGGASWQGVAVLIAIAFVFASVEVFALGALTSTSSTVSTF